MRTLTPIAAATLMLVAAPAFAQDTPAAGMTAPATTAPAATTAPPGAAASATPAATAPAAGQTVYDTAGGTVGKIDKIQGQIAVVATGKNNVGLPLTSFAMGPNGPVIAMTRDQVDAAAAGASASAAAKTAASITAGASVKDQAGAAVGTIKSVEGEFALLDTSKVQVKLPLSAFAAQGDGLIVSMSKAQIESAAAASTPVASK